jgi:hypothetical protein
MGTSISVIEGGLPVGFPEWIRFFINLGARWTKSTSRRLLLVSTPCDSQAAGLVALGAMVTRMGQRAHDEQRRHYLRLWEFARSGRPVLLRHRVRKGLFSTRLETTPAGSERVTIGKHEVPDSERFLLLEANAVEWRIDGDPVQEIRQDVTGGRIPYESFYAAITGGETPILEENLARTDSRILLAGRASGLQFTYELMSSIEFELEGKRVTLAELLTISGWAPARVSWIRYRSSRRVKAGATPFDRPGGPPEIIIADGYGAFLEVLNDTECQESNADVIGIFDRTGDADSQEALMERLTALRQWYQPAATADVVGELPAGISASLLQKSV